MSTELTHNTSGALDLMRPETFEHVQRLAKAYSSSSIVPKEYQGASGVANCVVAIELAARMSMSPTLVMQNLYIVHGRPTWKSEFVIARLHSKFSEIDFEHSKDNGGSCRVVATRHDGRKVQGTWVSMKMATDEGWSTKSGSKWKTMPEQMLMYRAATFFARVYAPSLLNGLAPHDEAQDYTPNASSSTADINARIVTNEVKFKVSEIEDAELIDDIDNDDAAIDEL